MATALLIAITSTAVFAGGATFTPMDGIPVDISGDGTVIVGYGGPYANWRWTEETGYVDIGGVEVRAVSNDGMTIVGQVVGPSGKTEAAYWLGGTDWEIVPPITPGEPGCGSSITTAYDVADDGTMVGLSWLGGCADAHGFRHTGGVTEDLGSIVAGRASRANAISADGAVIAGWSDTAFGARPAATWDGTWSWLVDPDVQFVGEVQGLSSDGSILVGGNFDAVDHSEGWYWTAESGVVPIGTVRALVGGISDGQTIAGDVSDDGEVIIGTTTVFNLGLRIPFIWTPKRGIQQLQDYMVKNGAKKDLDGWTLFATFKVSDDGNTIIGTAIRPGGFFGEGFRGTLGRK